MTNINRKMPIFQNRIDQIELAFGKCSIISDFQERKKRGHS